VRRFALSTVLLGLFGASVVAAQDEIFYLSSSNQEVDVALPGDDDNIVTKLYEVVLVDVTGEAIVTEIATSPLNQADAIACNQSGRCYILDRFLENDPDFEDGGFVEEYDVSVPDPIAISDSKLTEDTLGFPAVIQGVVLAAFHPDGTLYAASQEDDRLYTIDLDLENNLQNPTAEVVGFSGAIIVEDTGATLDIEGADLVFTSDHRAFIWTNGETQGLFELFLPTDQGQPAGVEDTMAVQLEEAMGVPIPDFATGLGVRGNGTGNLVLSTTLDSLSEHSLEDGAELNLFALMQDGEVFEHGSGDMANPLNSLLRCTIDEPVIVPGNILTIMVEFFFNSDTDLQQRFDFEVLDSNGNDRLSRVSRPFDFSQGDTMSYTINLMIPPAAPDDDYTIHIEIQGLPEGEAVGECGFTVQGIT